MKMFNPTMMWFSKNVQKLENEQNEQEQIPTLEVDDVLGNIDVAPSIESTNKENTLEMAKNLEENNLILDKINTVVDAVKSALGLTDEAVTEESAEVGEDAQEEEKPESEETEVVEGQEQDDEQPKNETEENEPSEEETADAGEEVEEEEKSEEGQEEPADEEQPAEEIEAEEQEEEQEQQEEEKPEGEEVADVADAVDVAEIEIQDKTENEDDEKGKLLQEIENLKAEKAEKELQLQKMALSKEVEKDFSGVPGKLEDKVDMVFEIKNSALSDETKEIILASLKQLSVKNLKDCEEIGHNQEVEVDENAEKKAKVEQAIKEHGLTENQAFLYVNGDRTLEDAKRLSNKIRNKK